MQEAEQQAALESKAGSQLSKCVLVLCVSSEVNQESH